MQLDAIRQAIANGKHTVEFNGKSVTYRSLDEMIRIERLIAQGISPAVNRGPATLATFTRD